MAPKARAKKYGFNLKIKTSFFSPEKLNYKQLSSDIKCTIIRLTPVFLAPKAPVKKYGFNLIIADLYIHRKPDKI